MLKSKLLAIIANGEHSGVAIMRDYGYVDMRGIDVCRKIVRLAREYSGRDARFDLTDGYLRVVIPASRDKQPKE